MRYQSVYLHITNSVAIWRQGLTTGTVCVLLVIGLINVKHGHYYIRQLLPDGLAHTTCFPDLLIDKDYHNIMISYFEGIIQKMVILNFCQPY